MPRKYTTKEVKRMIEKESEVWLYSYTDLVTNLLAFFIMLLVIHMAEPSTASQIMNSIAEATGNGGSERVEKVFANEVTNIIKENQLNGAIALSKKSQSVSLTFSGSFFFKTLSAEITADAKAMLDKFIPVFKKLPSNMRIDVSGHADSRPIKAKQIYPSNWELSAARSGSVVRYLASKGIPPRKLRAIGYSDTRPVSSKNLQMNRRVVIRVGKGLTE